MEYTRAFWVVFLLAAVLAGCGGASGTATPASPQNTRSSTTTASPATTPASASRNMDKLEVVTTVSPLANIIYNVGGERINVSGIVPEGVNSHTFEPAPSDAQKLAKADLIFVNGLDLEEPTVKLAEANKAADAEIISLGEQTIKPEKYVYDFSFPKEAGSPNPHLWPNPIYALRYAGIARDALIRRDPDGATYYRKNYDAFETRINELDKAIKTTVESIPNENRKLLTYHDSFAYFAPRYGLTVIGAIQPSDFAEPSAQEVSKLIDQLKKERVPAIFGSEVFPSPVLDQIAKGAGVKYVDTLRDDDLPGKPGEPKHSYVGLIVQDVEIMTRSLGGKPELISGFDTSNVPGADASVRQSQ